MFLHGRISHSERHVWGILRLGLTRTVVNRHKRRVLDSVRIRVNEIYTVVCPGRWFLAWGPGQPRGMPKIFGVRGVRLFLKS